MRAASLALAALLLSALCLTACGSSSSSSTSTETTATAPRPGGEASIEGFGEEAAGEARAAILAAYHAYLGALAERDYAAACSHLGARVKRSISQIARGSQLHGCAAILPRLLAAGAPRIAREQDEGEVKKVRTGEGRAFVVFAAPGARLYQLTMASEGGAWKAQELAGSVLVPSAATLGG